MKTIKQIVFSMAFFVATNSQSQFIITLGYDCYHNGEYYATVMTDMTCPVPGSGFTIVNIGDQYMDRHDPNDHECVITRVRRENPF